MGNETEGNLNNSGTGDLAQNNQTASTVDRPAWTSQLADDYKTNAELGQYKTITDLAKDTLRFKSEASSALKMPGENAPAEEWATFYGKLGRPETPDGYKLPKIDLPEWMDAPDYGKGFTQWAHKHGLSQRAAEGLYKDLSDDMIKQAKELQDVFVRRQVESENRLKDIWKTEYDANRELGIRAVELSAKKLLGDEVGGQFTKFLHDSRFTDDPTVIQFFHALGKAMDSDKSAFGGSGGGGEGKYNKTDKYGRPMLDYPSMDGQNR